MNIERLMLNPDGKGALVMSNGEMSGTGETRLTAMADFADAVAISRRLDTAGAIATNRLQLNFAGSYGLTQWLEATVQVPVTLNQGGDLGPTLSTSIASAGLGSPILALRAGVPAGMLPFSLSAELGGQLPVGDPAALGTDVRPQPLVRINAGMKFDFVNVFAELNAVEHPDRSLRSIRNNTSDMLTDEIGGGLGASASIPGVKELSAEVALATAYDFKNPGVSTDLHVGLRYSIVPGLQAFVAGGPSFGSLVGTPVFRAFGGFAYAMEGKAEGASKPIAAKPAAAKVDKCSAGQPHTPAECPDADDDGDGIANKDDLCPTAAEDKDGFQDADGCPDPDNDGDGIADADDKCPNEPGIARLQGCPIPDKDHDGIADADDKCPNEPGLAANGGCPVKDSDNDGIVDSKDLCPNAAGLMELRGCPANDSDGDGIADHLDNCPKEKGPATNSGCPAKKKQFVVITRESLQIKDRIYFGNTNAKVMPKSNKLLKNIAEVLKSHAYLEKLVIEGHTDDKGDAGKNRDLSLARANAVRSFLIHAGVEPGRLDTKGYGGEKPIDTNKTAEGRANNRRVEFTVVMPQEEKSS